MYIVSYLSTNPHDEGEWHTCRELHPELYSNLHDAEMWLRVLTMALNDNLLYRLTFGESNVPLALYRNGERIELADT